EEPRRDAAWFAYPGGVAARGRAARVRVRELRLLAEVLRDALLLSGLHGLPARAARERVELPRAGGGPRAGAVPLRGGRGRDLALRDGEAARDSAARVRSRASRRERRLRGGGLVRRGRAGPYRVHRGHKLPLRLAPALLRGALAAPREVRAGGDPAGGRPPLGDGLPADVGVRRKPPDRGRRRASPHGRPLRRPHHALPPGAADGLRRRRAEVRDRPLRRTPRYRALDPQGVRPPHPPHPPGGHALPGGLRRPRLRPGLDPLRSVPQRGARRRPRLPRLPACGTPLRGRGAAV
ncbi:MAG: hypothetical protein AVDCRST_MAG25-299, partial [uncultured Rubrobacteraceae bacterium]